MAIRPLLFGHQVSPGLIPVVVLQVSVEDQYENRIDTTAQLNYPRPPDWTRVTFRFLCVVRYIVICEYS